MSDFEQPVQPMSRAEAILRKYGDVTPMSRVEDLLKELVDESGGSSVTVTPVLSEGVRLATIGVDGTDYNIYAPEDVVGSIVSVTTEYNTGTLLATITVNDVDHYIYVPEANNILSGSYTPSASIGEDNDIFIKYDSEDVETEYSSVMSEQSISLGSTKTATVNLEGKYHVKIVVKSGYSPNPVLNTVIELVSEMSNRIQLMSDLVLTINGTTWTIQNTQFNTSYKVSASATELLSSTPTNINTPYAKLKGTWFPFPDKGNVEDVYINGTSVLDENSIARIKSYQEITKAEYDALPNSKLTDDILYCITDASSGTAGLNVSVEKILDQHVSTTGVFELDDSIDNYDALLIGGYNYVKGQMSNQYKTTLILKEDYYKNTSNHADHILGNMTGSSTGDNPRRVIFYFPDDTHINIQARDFASIDKIFGLKFEQGGGSSEVNYSTEEQVIGTWIDGKPIYQKTFVISPLTVNTTKTALPSSILTELANAENFISGFCVRLKSEGITTNTTPLAVWLDGSTLYVYSIVQSNNMTHFTFQYTKTTD